MWSAEQRQDRHTAAVKCTPGPVHPRTWQFVNHDEQDPAHRTKREQTTTDKLNRQQLREKGDSCMNCSLDKKACDLNDQCSKCALLCFRGIDQLWLWNAIEQTSLQPGSRKRALSIARSMTFTHSSNQLRALPRLGQEFFGNNAFPVIYLTTKLDDSTSTSRIVVNQGPLAASLQSMPLGLNHQIKNALAVHIPDAVLPYLRGALSAGERNILASGLSAFRIYTFLANAAGVNYHASPRTTSSAREASCFFMECCARLLAIEVEEVLTLIRTIVRECRDPGNVVKHVFGLYYSILIGLEQLNTDGALEIIMSPLVLRASRVKNNLSSLYQNIYGSVETLQAFVDNNIPMIKEINDLHLSHELLSAIDNTVTSWNPILHEPFYKDFSLLLHDLLGPDDRVTWISNIHHVQHSILSPPNVNPTGTAPTQEARLGRSGSSPSQPLYVSPDATLLNSSWHDGSTFIQSPSEVGQVAPMSPGDLTQIGDVKTPHDLFGITGNTGKDPKRALSPSSRSAAQSPARKRSLLDSWFELEKYFSEERDSAMRSGQAPGV